MMDVLTCRHCGWSGIETKTDGRCPKCGPEPQPAPSAAEHNPNQYYEPPQMKARDDAFSAFCSKYDVPKWEDDKAEHNRQWRAFRESYDAGYAAAERRARDAEAALREAQDWRPKLIEVRDRIYTAVYDSDMLDDAKWGHIDAEDAADLLTLVVGALAPRTALPEDHG